MNSNLEHKNWQQKLSRWLSGDANRRDELHLEKMGREDSFLADAMEGYRSLPAENHTRKVTQLKAKLRQKNQQKKGVAWMKIAAIGAFLVVALFGLREYNQSLNTEGNISQKTTITAKPANEQPITEKQNVPQTAPTQEIKKENVTDELASKTPNLQTPKPLKDKANSKTKVAKEQPEVTSILDYASTSDVVIEQPSPKVSADTYAENTSTTYDAAPSSASPNDPGAPQVFTEEPVATTAPPSPLDEAEFDKAYEPVILSANDAIVAEEEAENDSVEKEVLANNSYIGRVVRGKVLSEGGEPLNGANVIITGTPASTTTDFDGDFMLNVPDNASIDIQLLGYNDLRVDLQHQDELEVNMEKSDMDLSSIAVTAQKSSRKKGKKRSKEVAPNNEFKQENVEAAAPKLGVSKFEKYIEQNRRYPEEAKQNDVSDTVIVQFKVKKNGNLTDFKILKSVGFGCDEEAIRLLKEGPKWETDIDTVLSYEIEFKNW